MDPQFQAFTPYSSSSGPADGAWRLQNDVARVQQVQAEHAERIARLERRQDEDARVKSVWGNQSPFPSVLTGTGGTPNQAPLNQPPSDQFRNFDDEANSLINSLTNLDAEDEPRRGLGAASRANSVRFDETANQNHFAHHSSRSSVDFLSRSSSGGLGGLQMNERTSSHKSEGRASSAHSMRSAASGRANSLNLDTTYGMSDSRASPLDPPSIAPGMLLLGSVPAIIRCWMNMNFKHDSLLYAAVCTGSHKSFINLQLVHKLGYGGCVREPDDEGMRTIRLPIFFPEAVQQPAPSRSIGPTPSLPNLTVDFTVVEVVEDENEKAIQIFLGSDMLRAHSADVLFSSNRLTLFDDERHKLSMPLHRPEQEATFKNLYITSGTPRQREHVKEQPQFNGLGQGSSAASVSSGRASPRPTAKYRPPGALAAEPSDSASVKAGAGPGSEGDFRPASRQSNASRPSLNLNTSRSEVQESVAQPAEAASTSTPLRSGTGTSPATWGNWRRETSANTPASTTTPAVAGGMDWASSSRNREASYQRRDTGIKVLKPKAASRTFSSTAAPTAPDSGAVGSSSAKSSRFFDDGRRKSEAEPKTPGPVGEKKEGEGQGEQKKKANPIGTGSAFSWLNGPKNDKVGALAQGKARHEAGGEHGHDVKDGRTRRTSLPTQLITQGCSLLPECSPHLDSPTTASAQKRRKVGLFGGAAAGTESSSSPTPSGADSPSPITDDGSGGSISRGASSPTHASETRSSTTPTPPPRFLPPHLRDEVRSSNNSDSNSGGVSPIASLERVSLDSTSEGGASFAESSMSGEDGQLQRQKTVSPGPNSGVSVRSASPAKRSRADMEGDQSERSCMPGSFGREEESKMTDFDEAMAGMTPAPVSAGSGDAETQTTVEEGAQGSMQESMATASTEATSFQSEETPSDSVLPTTEKVGTSIPSVDEQQRIVVELHKQPLDEGQRGYAYSKQWLNRVLSRTSEGITRSEYPKEAREGPIGPVDNSDLVPDGKFPENPVRDANNKPYIPLKPGLVMDEDYVLLPHEAYGHISTWYGCTMGQPPIIRYAHNTAPADAALPNMEYELHPPVFTIRKVPQPAQEEHRPKAKTSFEKLKKRREAHERGQISPDDAFRLVASRSEKFQQFLRRAKEAADIPFSTKVKIWRTSKASNAVAKGNPTGVLFPPQSRSASPNAEPPPSLIIDAATFNKMEDCELIDGKDETGNSNYNGSSTMDIYQLFEDSTLVLEEQIGGPAGGEYASDKKPKHTIKLGIPGRSLGSKAPSAAPSRGTSPAPGGMMTRGRQRRDGRTRGTVGLSNLGNTCYMNSALQCIRSVEELAVYFLSEKYKKEINAGNPLGHGGVMAKQYATLLNNIYGENAGGSFTPSAFKKTLGQLQPMFSGYGQQDSQEFLSFLVDAIHEDLNRIIKKPYNENPDSDDNTVRDPQAIIDLGETYRANHRARNESIAMDLFNGFYKNTMECPDCGKISITFDPFSLVTVQLPIESMFTHTYIFVPLDGKPVRHDIDFDKNGTIRSLKEYVASKHPGVEANRLWMAEVYSHKLYKVFEDAATLAEAAIGNNDHIFIFELPDVPTNAPTPPKVKKYSSYGFSNNQEDAPAMDDPKADKFAVPVFSRQKNRFGNGWEFILHPTYIVLTREEAKDCDVVRKKTLVAISRLTTMPILTELNDLKDDDEESTDEKTETGDESADDKEVSDRSASEDGYVEISKHADAEAPQTNGDAMDTNGVAEKEDRPIPKGFMEPEYVLPPALQNQLFVLKYGKGKEGMHCTGLSSIDDRNVLPMLERVKLPARRGSTDSGSSGDESTTSTASGPDANGDREVTESDLDFDDKPDIVIGGSSEDSLGLPNTMGDGNESDDLPDNPLQGQKPGAMRGQKHWRGKNKGRNRRNKTYGKKDRQKQKHQPNGNGRPQFGGKSLAKQEDAEDNPYYIKLGEGIVLDWYPEALNHIFAGVAKDEDDKRGVFTSTTDGKGDKLPLFHDEVIEQKRAKRSARRKNGVSLEECFVETGKREVLSEDNAWYCGRCKELRRATKTLEIWTIPDILVVHLKRFGGNRSFRDKIDVLVDYPIEGLDMTERVGLKEDDKEYVYDLFAVDNHYGGLGGGHYTAYAKNFYDQEWYDYNDASCTKLGNRALQANAAAYLLFYRRRSPTPLGPQYLQDLVNESHNPVASNTDTEDTAGDESDSGEGRLGGRANGSQRSSGGWKGAGAPGAVAATGSGSLGGVRQEAGSSLMTKGMGTSEEEKGFYGPARPPPQYGDQGGSGWDFNGIDDEADAAGEDDGAGSDVGSTAANVDHDDDGDAFMSTEFDDGPPELEGIGPYSSAAGAGTPNDGDYNMAYDDDHTLYSTERGGYGLEDEEGSLHLEDAGGIGGDNVHSASTIEMRSPVGTGPDSEDSSKDLLE